MTTLLVISDTHANLSKIKKVSKLFSEYDYVFHLGDYYTDLDAYRKELSNKLYAVKGNCDFGGEPIFVNIEGVKIMAVHGNKFHVKSNLISLFLKAKEENCKLVLYGHTHTPHVETLDGITLVNPGALALLSSNTYAVVTIDNQDIKVTLHQI